MCLLVRYSKASGPQLTRAPLWMELNNIIWIICLVIDRLPHIYLQCATGDGGQLSNI